MCTPGRKWQKHIFTHFFFFILILTFQGEWSPAGGARLAPAGSPGAPGHRRPGRPQRLQDGRGQGGRGVGGGGDGGGGGGGGGGGA